MQSQIDEIVSLDLDSEWNILNITEVDKVVKFFVRWLRYKTTTRYFEDNPAVRDAIVTAAQEGNQPKPLPTPAPTPCDSNSLGEQPPTTLASRHVTQEKVNCDDQTPTPLASQHVAREAEFDDADPAKQHKGDSGKHYDKDLPAAQQELEQRSRLSKYTYVKAAYVSESEQSGGSQYSASLNGQSPADPDNDLRDHDDDFHDQDVRPNDRPLGQMAMSLTQNEPDTSQSRSRKRKYDFGPERELKRPNIEAADTTKVDLRSAPGRTVARSRRSSSIPRGIDLSSRGSDKFTKLSVHLRSKLRSTADAATLKSIRKYLKYKQNPPSAVEDCADASEQDESANISSSHQRLRKLKNRILRDEKDEDFVGQRQIATRISKRVALAELIGSYIEEKEAWKATPKKIRKKKLPPKNQFTDLLFPETIKYKGKRLSKKEEGPRQKAKKKLDYWIQLGEPLARIAKQHGMATVALLNEKLTDKNLQRIPRPQIQDVVDFIGHIRPGLKEQVSNLSAVLLQMAENRLPSQRLVLETLTSNLLPQLGDRPLEELFQFETKVIDSQQADALVGHSSDPGSAKGQLPYAQGITESAQICPEYTPESFQSHSPSAGMEDGNTQLSSTQRTIESVQNIYSDNTSPSTPSCSPSTDIEDPSSLQDIDSPTQPTPIHSWEDLNPQNYYDPEDWRAKPSDNSGGKFLEPQGVDLQRSDPSEVD